MKRILGFVVGAALTVVICLGVGEVALRAMGFSAPVWYRPDAQLGWSLRPGAKGWFTFEGRGFVQVSPAGFRDRTHDLRKPKNTYRVAVLGDSYAEAMQVDFKSTFWWQLQEKLQACAPKDVQVEVMNFGVSGYGTAQEAIQLERTAIRYEPDLVLLAFTNGNDLLNNSRKLETEKDRPFYTLDAQNNLRLDDSFAQSADFHARSEPWLEYSRIAADRFRIVQMAHQAKKTLAALKAKAGTAQATEKAPRTLPGVEPGTDASVLAPPRDATWQEAWAVTEALITRMNAFSKKHGAGFALTTIPYAAQVNPDRDLRRNLQDALGVSDLFYIERRMAALGQQQGFTVIPLAYEMQKRADSDGVYLHGFRNVALGTGHWNEAGHKMAAELLSQRLCGEAFPPK
ncbi:MAG: SGNH/GDSL hydrolase family protein [Clostridia bacterium]